MKEVVKLIEKVVAEKRVDRHQGLNVVLDFLIDVFDVKHYSTPGGWFERVGRAEKEENALYRIMMIWLDKVATAMEKGTWLDFFGGVYEEMYQSKMKASTLGQFFTPPAVCDMLAYCTKDSKGKVSDCACGSGRLLLAAGAIHGFPRDSFYVGEDLDMASVKMCALNLMVHGCRGRVVQHDTLANPIMYDYGFRLNDIRFPILTPFYSLTPIKLTKEDVDRRNEKVRKKYGDEVEVFRYVGCEVVRPKEGEKPIFNPIFENPKSGWVRDIEVNADDKSCDVVDTEAVTRVEIEIKRKGKDEIKPGMQMSFFDEWDI